VVALVNQELVPVRVHVREHREAWQRLGERFGAHWTPTTLIVDPGGVERHRVEGFLPAAELIAQLELGLARSAFARGDWADAERRFRKIVDEHADDPAAAEALYWAGVARYKATNDAAALGDTARAFQQRFQDTPWAKKASVWAG
jgi:hypothetical protein